MDGSMLPNGSAGRTNEANFWVLTEDSEKRCKALQSAAENRRGRSGMLYMERGVIALRLVGIWNRETRPGRFGNTQAVELARLALGRLHPSTLHVLGLPRPDDPALEQFPGQTDKEKAVRSRLGRPNVGRKASKGVS